MKLTLKESMDMLKKAELNRIKSELEPHFEEYGDLYITGAEDDTIKIEYSKGVCDWAFDNTIVNMSMNGLIDNCFDMVYNNTGLNAHDIFEDVGNNLTELGIKPVEPFHLEDWKKQLTEKYDLQIGEDGCILTKEGHVVIVDDNNVNNINWHNGDLIGHEKFRFNNNGGVYLKTKADCSEFERVFSNYIKKQSLYTICDDLKQHLSENFRDKLQVGESDHYGDCILYDDADVVINIKNYSNTFNNQWYSWLSNAGTLSSHINDIFEDVGPALEEIKVKPVKPFDIEQWKRDFVEKYCSILNLVNDTIVRYYGYTVIDADHDVNYSWWNDQTLDGHPKFKFTGGTPAYLETKVDCDEFEKIFSDYIESTKFDVNKWKQSFVEEYKLDISEAGRILYNDNVVINRDHDVNYHWWHNKKLEGHQKFKFNGDEPVFLNTEEDCLEFEEIFSNYITNQKYKTLKQLFPHLSTEEREAIGYNFAEVARALDIDIMYGKQEEDYFCNAYDIDQNRADMILALVKGDN